MIIDNYGLPKDMGASDYADSARLASLMAVIGHPQTPELDNFFIIKDGKLHPVRHPFATSYPENEPRVMSRDQLTCLAAGLFFQNKQNLAKIIVGRTGLFAPNNMDEKTKKWKIPDFIAPHVRQHYKVCAGGRHTWWSKILLKLDIKIFSKYAPMSESNQLIAMCLVAGSTYVKLFRDSNPQWKDGIENYWYKNAGSWRGEKELALALIKKIEES